jgi:competence protein ComFC
MKCLLCESLSFKLICSQCQTRHLSPSLYKREIDDFEVYSFYKYRDIEELLTTKHTVIGSSIFKILAQLSFKKFAQAFTYSYPIYAIPIDDRTRSGYSHTAILAHALRSDYIHPVFGKLRAQNPLTYSGKTRIFREENPRRFRYTLKPQIEAILVDDIITTGCTLQEAKEKLLEHDATPLFALTLADARDQ